MIVEEYVGVVEIREWKLADLIHELSHWAALNPGSVIKLKHSPPDERAEAHCAAKRHAYLLYIEREETDDEFMERIKQANSGLCAFRAGLGLSNKFHDDEAFARDMPVSDLERWTRVSEDRRKRAVLEEAEAAKIVEKFAAAMATKTFDDLSGECDRHPRNYPDGSYCEPDATKFDEDWVGGAN